MRLGRSLLVNAAAICVALTSTQGARAQNAIYLSYYNAGMQAFNDGKYPEAEKMFLLAVSAGESIDPQGALVGAALAGLGSVYQKQSKYDQAMAVFEQSYVIIKKAGPTSEMAGNVLRSMAEINQVQAKYAEAEPLFKQALPITESVFGKDNSWTILTVTEMADMYRAWGKFDDAQPLYDRALATTEKNLGPKDVGVASLLNSIAFMYLAQGKFEPSERAETRALTIVTDANNQAGMALYSHELAVIFHSQQTPAKYEEAATLYRQALVIVENIKGADDPAVALYLDSLAALLDDQKKYAESGPLYKRALAIREKSLDADDVLIARSLVRLAEWTLIPPPSAGADDLETHSWDVPTTGPAVVPGGFFDESLAGSVVDPKVLADAQQMLQRALQIRQKSLSAESPDIAQALYRLANVYRLQKKNEVAEPLYKRAIAIYDKSTATRSSDFDQINCLGEYAIVLTLLGKNSETAPINKRAADIRAKYK